MIRVVTHAHLVPIWYHSKHSDIPYFPNQFLDKDLFATYYRKPVKLKAPQCPSEIYLPLKIPHLPYGQLTLMPENSFR